MFIHMISSFVVSLWKIPYKRSGYMRRFHGGERVSNRTFLCRIKKTAVSVFSSIYLVHFSKTNKLMFIKLNTHIPVWLGRVN